MAISALIPSADLAPSVTSRVLLVRAVDFTEGAPATGSITFELPWDVDVKADGVILKAGKQTLEFDANGEMRIRVPTADPDTNPDAWFLVVKKSWAPHPYAIRVPVGTTVINLVDCPLVEELPAGAAPGFLLTGASVTTATGAQWDATVDVAGGIANIHFTVPPGGVAYWRGATSLQSASNIDTLESGVYTVWSAPVAAAIGLPVAQLGVLTVSTYGTSGGTQTYQVSGAVPQSWARNKVSASAWGAWLRVDGNAEPFKGLAPSTGTANDLVTRGFYEVQNGAHAIQLGLPGPGASGGALLVLPAGNLVQQVYLPIADPAQLWIRYGRTSWVAWARMATLADVPAPSKVRSPSGFRTAALALSRGTGGSDGPLEQTVRFPLQYNAPITRWRLHLRNINARSGSARAGAISVSGLWLGEDAGTGGFKPGFEQIHGPFATPADGAEWVSPWFSRPIGGGVGRLLSLGYTTPSAPWLVSGGCWRSASVADAGAQTPALAVSSSAPFDVWIEAETYAATPVIAVAGDSLSIAVGAALPVYDSPLSIYCRTHRALPVHYAHSGDAMSASLVPGAFKWTQYASTDKPDCVLLAMGANDVFGGSATLAQMQERHASYAAILATIAPVIYGATLMPATNTSGTQEGVRRAYNAWLTAQPNGIRDLFDFAAAISADDETIRPEYDADGLHLNTVGYAALAAAITRPITSPAPVYSA